MLVTPLGKTAQPPVSPNTLFAPHERVTAILILLYPSPYLLSMYVPAMKTTIPATKKNAFSPVKPERLTERRSIL